MNMIIQVTLGNLILTGLGITIGVVVFVAMVWIGIRNELGDLLGGQGKHKAMRR